MKSLGSNSLNGFVKVKSVKLLGVKEKIDWEQTESALIINTNNIKTYNSLVWVFKIKIKQKIS